MKIEFDRTKCEGREAAIIEALSDSILEPQMLRMGTSPIHGAQATREAYTNTLAFMVRHFPDLNFRIE